MIVVTCTIGDAADADGLTVECVRKVHATHKHVCISVCLEFAPQTVDTLTG